jgi:hypothetical protein
MSNVNTNTVAVSFEVLKAGELANLRRERRKAAELFESKREGYASNPEMKSAFDALSDLITKMDDLIQKNVDYAVAQIEARRAKVTAAEEKRVAKLKAK